MALWLVPSGLWIKGSGFESWMRTFHCGHGQDMNLTVLLYMYTQVHKWVQAKLMLGVTLRWTSIAERSRNTPSCVKLQKPGKALA